MNKIRTMRQYNNALARINEIFDAKPDTSEGEELKSLVLMVEEYEDSLIRETFKEDYYNLKEEYETSISKLTREYNPKDSFDVVGFQSKLIQFKDEYIKKLENIIINLDD